MTLAPASAPAHRLRLGVDTGGTFTDLVVEGLPGGIRLYKSPTVPSDPIRGLQDAVAVAAADLGTTSAELLASTDVLIHGTTRATNAIVEERTARTAFLTTEGHRDVLVIREGGGRTSPMDYTQRYPDPYVPRALSFGIPERVRASGEVRDPLDEAAAVEVIRQLPGLGVEAVGVCLLWSIRNPAHELRLGELIEEHAPGLAYTLSHQLNPTLREYRRASSTVIDASLKPLMVSYISRLDSRLREAGFAGRLLILTSAGGMLDASDVAQTPIHSIGSGPAAAPVAGRYFAGLDSAARNVIVTDAGGTTYDVGLIRDGEIPWTRETLVGHSKQGYMTGFPAVDVRSVGAGGGSIGWVDDGGLLRVGPHSAGADPGPVCWGRGGTQPTVTDACVVLGYVDPEYFLGGAIAIDVEAARRSLSTDVAEPLGISVEEAAMAVFNLACERMVTAIEEITLSQGIDPTTAVMVGGGGGAGLYSVTIGRRLSLESIVIPAVSAALSAAGAVLSDLTRDFALSGPTTTGAFDRELANSVLAELSRLAGEFIAGPGDDAPGSTVTYSAEARYTDQVWEIEVPLPTARFEGPEDVEALKQRFNAVHDDLFAVSDDSSEVEVVTWRARVRCPLRTAPLISPARDQSRDASARRRAYFGDGGWVDASVRPVDSLAADELIQGPALVESPVTTIVIPPGATALMSSSGSLLVTPGTRTSPKGPTR